MTKSIIQADPAKPDRDTRGSRLIITIDGPAGAGKSTVARLLATRLRYHYLDTGSLYRAIAWKVRTAGIDPADRRAVAGVLESTRIAVEQDPERPRVFIDSREVTEEIRTPEISRLASQVSAIPAVREWLLPIQRRIGEGGGVVAEGRDLGTRVFPKADVKFFLEADTAVRAARRQREMTAAGQGAPALEETRREMDIRDRQDRTRDVAPLIAAPDATTIDSSTLGAEQVVERMLLVVAAKL